MMTQYFNPNYVRRHFSILINITNIRHLKSPNGFQSLSFFNSLALTHQHIYFQHCLLPAVNSIHRISFPNEWNQRSREMKIERKSTIYSRGEQFETLYFTFRIFKLLNTFSTVFSSVTPSVSHELYVKDGDKMVNLLLCFPLQFWMNLFSLETQMECVNLMAFYSMNARRFWVAP